MIRIFTDSTVNRRECIKEELEYDDCIFYFPKYTDCWNNAYNNIHEFLQKYKDNKEIALILPETGLGIYGVQNLALTYFTDKYAKNKIIYVSTDSQYLFDWIRCCAYLQLVDHNDVEIFHRSVLGLDKQSRINEWPEDMFPFEWTSEILLSIDRCDAMKTLKNIKHRQDNGDFIDVARPIFYW